MDKEKLKIRINAYHKEKVLRPPIEEIMRKSCMQRFGYVRQAK